MIMFCHKCGARIADGAAFCHKCGTKAACTDTASAITSLDDPKTIPNTEQLADPVEMTISIKKVEGRAYSKFRFAILVDGAPIGELSNGETSTYIMQPGQHCIKIGVACIWIHVPRENIPITLNFVWGPNVRHEITCHPSQIVTKPSEIEKAPIGAAVKKLSKGIVAGLVCIGLGVTGLITGIFLFPHSSGSIVTAGQHIAMSEAMAISLPFFIGGIALFAIGGVILILSSRKR